MSKLSEFLTAAWARFTIVPGLAVALGCLIFVSGLTDTFDLSNRRLMTGLAAILFGIACHYLEDLRDWDDAEERWRLNSGRCFLGALFFTVSAWVARLAYTIYGVVPK